MRYDEAANFLLDLRRYRPSPGTESTADLLSWLDDPHEGPEYVQIAGSNGKGSTARMLERVLAETDLDVGLYTSPHLDDVRERIRVNDRIIPESAVTAFAERIQPRVTEQAADNDAPTFFEVLTTMALWYFGTENVDVAILEVGIGGRYDATSVVDPVASGVTSVTLEHTSVLGDTIAEIARDKATVAPAERPLVTGTTGAALEAVSETAGRVVTVGGPDADVTARYGGATEHYEGRVDLDAEDWAVETTIPLLGAHQARNAGIAAALARQVADVTDADLARGLRKGTWPGRFEVVDREPLVVLDGAHNPGGMTAVAETLADLSYDDLHVVVGSMQDKDHAGMADALPEPASVLTCRPDTDRAEDQDVLSTVFERHSDDVRARSSVEGAVDRAIEGADDDDCVLVTGSLSTVAEARRRWTRCLVPRTVDSLNDAARVLERAHVTSPGIWRMRAKGDHRVISTRVQKRQAQYLKEEMLSLGGECAISGLNDQHEEYLDVVLMGTLAQYNRLLDKLDGQPFGLSVFADELQDTLDIRSDSPETAYPWETGTAVMGILNVTPDSFHDGGLYETTEAAVERAEEMIAAGVDIIDVGGESTRPGADPVPPEIERDRVVPVVEALQDHDVLLSVDTRRAAVGRAALEAGADILNDVTGLDDPEMRFVAATHDVPLVVMHSIDAPVDPTADVEYDDVVDDVLAELAETVHRAEQAGLDRSQIIVDPGLGFGKTQRENFALLDRIDEFHALGGPVLVGHSHKSMFEAIDLDADERGPATVAATALAADRGADIVRVHDVKENVDAVKTVLATRSDDG
ncbi:dihydropteroate synthase [Halanaeroarchaeum sulfurireducens]|uniref:Probable bifunctional folylpolyglutamate synthase/dihydropteroate synthase n=1 Tax=Halanaeroarchaeum sulfurireducens TaxID=1604004 RepID=A0A0F7PC50_9EURY|nr:dihydropteroate synthase [Halanaeroarchaeum sulfurireducens]AKH97204.1 dihydrofolate/dihydropteroate synthase [Halanaeroarchaeum sulfurireducens]ALG81606.1 dihydrofolate/dihydropteroate synthase [Halanaeroarchaeum sulfurireducens]